MSARPDPPDAPRRTPGGFPVVGVIGGGQLARMMQGPAVELGVQLSVLAEAPDASAALVVPSAPVGSHTDLETVCAFARQCDVVTFDHEHVPADVLAALEADGVALHPSPAALVLRPGQAGHARAARGARGPVPALGARAVTADDVDDLRDDGRVAGRGEDTARRLRRQGRPRRARRRRTSPTGSPRSAEPGPLADGVLLEERVAFSRELAVLVARSPSGQAAAWPVVETVQTDGICTEVLAPAPGHRPGAGRRGHRHRPADRGGARRDRGARGRDVRGAGRRRRLAPAYLVNELAMRPHNSGHWSMDGAVTGQFEQHLRAVLDLPLGDPSTRAPWTVMANVLGGEHDELYSAYRHVMARDPGLKVHLYGKAVRPGRKIGHVNVSARSLTDARTRATHAADYIAGAIDE